MSACGCCVTNPRSPDGGKRSPEGGRRDASNVYQRTITSSADTAGLQGRMPVLLEPEAWLAGPGGMAVDLLTPLRPAPTGTRPCGQYAG